MSDLEVTVEQLENAVAVHATGSVDSNTAPQLQEPLLRAAEMAPCSSISLRFRT